MSDKRAASPRGSLPKQVRNALVLLTLTQYPPLKRLFQQEVEKLALECGLWPKGAASAWCGQDPSPRRVTSGSITDDFPGAGARTQSRAYVRCRLPRSQTVAAPRGLRRRGLCTAALERFSNTHEA